MALYLGTEKIAPIVNGGTNCKTGVATSNSNGIVTFPALNFTPSLIAMWNVQQEVNDGDVPYLYTGVMLFAINQNGYWISQAVESASGGAFIANGTATGGTGEFFPDKPSSCISVNGNIYSYQIAREADHPEFTNTEFHYAIYG
jgi:hypothetical protein